MANNGRISTNGTPGMGKSGNRRRDWWSLILRWASSEVLEEEAVECRETWAVAASG